MQNVNNSDLPDMKRLQDIMATLRNPESGCPWDVQQTMESLTRYTIEEAYEVADAIAKGDRDDIRDELGDLLFQVVFYARIAEEEGAFTFNDVARTISDKMTRRHPHVFGNNHQSSMDDKALTAQWDMIKAQEKAAKQPERQCTDNSILDNIPTGMPALMYAQKLQRACAKVGFDWPEVTPVLEKVREEVEEIQQELDADIIHQQALEEEIGDALFAMVNVARHCKVDADTALRNASNKFSKRFKAVEAAATRENTTLEAMSLEQMEALWQKAKLGMGAT